jgi:sugar lactone lactonase YvrE
MGRTARFLRRGLPLLVASGLLVGCGVLVTGGIAGGIFAIGGSGSHGNGGSSTSVDSASVPFDNTDPVVPLTFTLSNPSSESVQVEIRFSVTGTNVVAGQIVTRTADPSNVPFPSRPLPDDGPAGLATTATGSPNANDATLATSPSGISYTFDWNSAQDVGAFAYINNVRLQILVNGVPAFTLSPFSVDNTALPIVSSAAPDPSILPAGATVYSDQQTATASAPGHIPIKLTIMDAGSAPVSLSVLYATGSSSFSTTNVAAGVLVDDATGQTVPIGAVPTAPAGLSYTFQFQSASNGVGTPAPVTSAALQFTATATKTGLSVVTPSFAVNDTSFSAVPDTPVGVIGPSVGYVTFTYDLFDNDPNAPGLDVAIQYSLAGTAGPFVTCTQLDLAASQGLTGLSTPAAHTFLWNAYQDMIAGTSRPVPADSNIVLAVYVTRPSTGVVAGPFFTQSFSVDQRLITTTLGGAASFDSEPTSVAYVANNTQGRNVLYFVDVLAKLVRALDVTVPSSPVLSVAVGGGTVTTDGTLASQFQVKGPVGVAAAADAFFLSEDASSNNTILRVDGFTPVVTALSRESETGTVVYEPFTQVVYYVAAATGSTPTGRAIFSIPSVGGASTPIAGGGLDAADGNVPAASVQIETVNGLASNQTNYPSYIFYTDIDPSNVARTRLRAVNISSAADSTFSGYTISPQCVQTLGLAALESMTLTAVAVDVAGHIDVSTVTGQPAIWRIDDTVMSATSPVTLAGGRFGFLGDGGPATSADLLDPTSICTDGAGGIYIADAGNGRVRQVNAAGTIETVEGTFPYEGDPQPATATTVAIAGVAAPTAKFDAPLSVLPYAGGYVVAEKNLSRIRFANGASLEVSTLAGNGLAGVAGDGGLATNANLGLPTGMCTDPSGNLYVTQVGEALIRRIATDSATGAVTISTVAGILSATPFHGSDGISGSGPLPLPLFSPRCLAYFSGLLVVTQPTGSATAVNQPQPLFGCVTAINLGSGSESAWNQIVPPSSAQTIAGDDTTTTAITLSPSSPTAANALLVNLVTPSGLCVNPSTGTLYIADQGAGAVYALNATTGAMTLIAGTPGSFGNTGDGALAANALLGEPSGLCLDPTGNGLYVIDSLYNVLRVINIGSSSQPFNGVTVAAGDIATVAGNNTTSEEVDGQPAVQAHLDIGGAGGLAALGENFYTLPNGAVVFPEVATGRIRMVDASGNLWTVAGANALDGDGQEAEAAALTDPSAIGMRSDGTLLVADFGRIREIPQVAPIVTRTVGTGLEVSSGDGGPALFASIAHLVSGTSSTSGFSFTTDLSSDVNGPRAVCDSTGNANVPGPIMAIADTLTNSIRIVNRSAATAVSFTNGTTLMLGPGDIGTYPGLTLTEPEGVAFTTSGLLLAVNSNPTVAGGQILGVNLTSAPLSWSGGSISPGAAIALVTTRNPHSAAAVPGTPVVVYAAGNKGSAYVAAANIGTAPFTAFGVTLAAGQTAVISTTNALGSPRGVAIDPTTNDAYYALRDTNQVFRVVFVGGANVLVAGNGTEGYTGDGGLATDAELNTPIGVAVDPWGSVYILDAGNVVVRRCRRFP